MNEIETEEFLASTITGFLGMEDALALRAAHWAHSGVFVPGRRMVVWTAKQMALVCRIPLGSRQPWRLARRPTHSRATLDGSRLVPDVAGLFSFECSVWGWARRVEVVAATPELLDRIGPVSTVFDRLIVLRNILNDPRCTAEHVIASLEGSNPTFGLDGALFGGAAAINLQAYGK